MGNGAIREGGDRQKKVEKHCDILYTNMKLYYVFQGNFFPKSNARVKTLIKYSPVHRV